MYTKIPVAVTVRAVEYLYSAVNSMGAATGHIHPGNLDQNVLLWVKDLS
jgi:hypothetical protein